MSVPMTLKDCINETVTSWPFGEQYRAVPDDPDHKQLFMINHIKDHLMKNLGKLADATEVYDHGNPLNTEQINEANGNLLKCCLRLAEVLHGNEAEYHLIISLMQ